MDIKILSQHIDELKKSARIFFSGSKKVCSKEPSDGFPQCHLLKNNNKYWDRLPKKLKIASQKTQEKSINLISEIIPVIVSSPILDGSDEKDISVCIKRMRAALRLRKYEAWEIEVLHDEGEVLGVQPPGQSEDKPLNPSKAKVVFFNCIDTLEGIVQLLKISPSNLPHGLHEKNPNLPQSYRPNTAFIMMAIDPNNPELEDIFEVYKEAFEKFGITAIRGDEIEHEDVITKRIIEEIKTCEFLLGDLTNERPSVYYEIGYAHSLGRRVILYRRKKSVIHFDLAAYNCPEYKNMKELKSLLLKRLEHVTNRKPKKE